MATFRVVKRSEIRFRKKLNEADLKLFEQLRGVLSRIDETEAAIYEPAATEDVDRAKALLRKAATILGIPVRIIPDSAGFIFYRRSPRSRRRPSEPKKTTKQRATA